VSFWNTGVVQVSFAILLGYQPNKKLSILKAPFFNLLFGECKLRWFAGMVVCARLETFRLTFTANVKPLERFLILQLYYNSLYTSFEIC
jgi:hypothetical protein